MTVADRYRAVGLERNPFIAQQEYGSSVTDIHQLFVSCGLPDPPPPGSRTFVQVIGDKGMGKSTHLEWWRSKIPGPLHYIPRTPYRARWKQPPLVRANFTEAIVYGDEIDRMPKALRGRWFRHLSQRRATLVVGTHEDLTNLACRAGFDVITHHLSPLDGPTLAEIIERRLAAFATGQEPRLTLSENDIDELLRQSAGNPREAEIACHQLIADRVAAPRPECS